MHHAGAGKIAACGQRLHLADGRAFAEINRLTQRGFGHAQRAPNSAKLVRRLGQRRLTAQILDVHRAAPEQRRDARGEAGNAALLWRRGFAAFLLGPGALVRAVRAGQERIAETGERLRRVASLGGAQGIEAANRRQDRNRLPLAEPRRLFVGLEARKLFVRLLRGEHFKRKLRQRARGHDREPLALDEVFDAAEQIAVERIRRARDRRAACPGSLRHPHRSAVRRL